MSYQQVEQLDGEDANRNPETLPDLEDSEIRQCLDMIPDGEILDFLMKYFAREVNW